MLPRRYRFSAGTALDVAGRDQRALRLIGVDIDETDVHAGKGSPALHVDGVMDHPCSVGQVAAVPTGEGAENLDILDRVIVAVLERERDQGFRAQPAPSPG